MGEQGKRVTLEVAMRVRDVSRPRAEDEEPPDPPPPGPREPSRAERHRLGKRQATSDSDTTGQASTP